jgi:hypothetical protein
MYAHYALMRTRQEELPRAAAQDRRVAQARQARRLQRQRTLPAPPKRLSSLRLHRLFS